MVTSCQFHLQFSPYPFLCGHISKGAGEKTRFVMKNIRFPNPDSHNDMPGLGYRHKMMRSIFQNPYTPKHNTVSETRFVMSNAGFQNPDTPKVQPGFGNPLDNERCLFPKARIHSKYGPDLETRSTLSDICYLKPVYTQSTARIWKPTRQ